MVLYPLHDTHLIADQQRIADSYLAKWTMATGDLTALLASDKFYLFRGASLARFSQLKRNPSLFAALENHLRWFIEFSFPKSTYVCINMNLLCLISVLSTESVLE